MDLETLNKIYQYIGPVGAILVVMSVFSLALILNKLFIFMWARLGRTHRVEQAMRALEEQGLQAVPESLGGDRHPVAKMLRTGAEKIHAGESRESVEAEIRAVATQEMQQLSRHDRLLELIGLIAPLLGLLGTIIGMIAAFQALQTAGSKVDPSVLAGGIWEALLTTALGLVVAIPAIVAFNMAENRLDRLRQFASVTVTRFLARAYAPE
jgi:biopolymer transport protein ExbB